MVQAYKLHASNASRTADARPSQETSDDGQGRRHTHRSTSHYRCAPRRTATPTPTGAPYTRLRASFSVLPDVLTVGLHGIATRPLPCSAAAGRTTGDQPPEAANRLVHTRVSATVGDRMGGRTSQERCPGSGPLRTPPALSRRATRRREARHPASRKVGSGNASRKR